MGKHTEGQLGEHAAPLKARPVSKSDELLFGPYARIVRELGVASDAAEEAHRMLRDRDGDVVGAGIDLEGARAHLQATQTEPVTDEQAERYYRAEEDRLALLQLTQDLRGTAANVHRRIAAFALRELEGLHAVSDNAPAPGDVQVEHGGQTVRMDRRYPDGGAMSVGNLAYQAAQALDLKTTNGVAFSLRGPTHVSGHCIVGADQSSMILRDDVVYRLVVG